MKTYFYANERHDGKYIVFAVNHEGKTWEADQKAAKKAKKMKLTLAGGMTDTISDPENYVIIPVRKDTKPYVKKADGRLAKSIIEWDTLAPEDEIELRMSDEAYEGSTREDVIDSIDTDAQYWEDRWDYMLQDLEDRMNAITMGGDGYWKAVGTRMGWRNLTGEKYFRADNAKDFLSAILPDTECTFKFYRNPRGFKMVAYHHDSPTGEFYTITKVAKSTFEKEVI